MSSPHMLSFDNALAVMLHRAVPKHQLERVCLSEALNRVAAEDIRSPLSIPYFSNAAMDGYAVRTAELKLHSIMPVVGTILAGQILTNPWPEQTCLRIMTGAALPSGADAVVKHEDAEEQLNQIHFSQPVSPRQNIRFVGEDIAKGDIVVERGQKLTVPILSMLATLGLATIKVYAPVRVALFSTGDELMPHGTPIEEGKIYDSNRLTIALLLKQLACEITDLGILEDNKDRLVRTLTNIAEHVDLIITSGGVSVGEADYVKDVLCQLGNIDFWRVAIKPGKPFAFGHIGKTPFCGLPGNPISALVTFYQLVQPFIGKLSGNDSFTPFFPRFQVKTRSELKKNPGVLDFQRGKLSRDSDGQLYVVSIGSQQSHRTRSLSEANCFIILDADRTDVSIGDQVTVELFSSLLN